MKPKSPLLQYLDLLGADGKRWLVNVEVSAEHRDAFRRLKEIHLCDGEGHRIAREVGAWRDGKCQIEVLVDPVPEALVIAGKPPIPLRVLTVVESLALDITPKFLVPPEVRSKDSQTIHQWCRDNGLNPRWGLWESTRTEPGYAWEFSLWVRPLQEDYKTWVVTQEHGDPSAPATSECACLRRFCDPTAFDQWLCSWVDKARGL